MPLDDEKYRNMPGGKQLAFEGFDTVQIMEKDAIFHMEMAPIRPPKSVTTQTTPSYATGSQRLTTTDTANINNQSNGSQAI